MKIAMISEHASPLAALGGVDAGGQNVHVASLSRELAARGHDLTVFTRRDDHGVPATVSVGGVTVVHVDAGPARYIPKDDLLPYIPDLGRGIARYWEENAGSRPDVVHSHFWMSGLAARTAVDSAGLPDVPLVHTFHALGSVKRRHQGDGDTSPVERIDLEPRVGIEATRIIATCADEVSELAALGVPADKATVIPCGVDVELFRPSVDGDAVEQEEQEDTGGHRRIVSVGRLVPRKGVDVLVRALALLTGPEYSDVELHVVGGGESGGDAADDPEIRRLRDLATGLGVADRVVLRGPVPRERIPALIRSAEFVACTPWYEPFGIVPLEAMACGRPVIAARVGGLADTVVDGVTGIHVPPRDPAATACAAQNLLDNPGLCRTLGRHGHTRVSERYTWRVVAAETERIYRELSGLGTAVMPFRENPAVSEHLEGVSTAVTSLRRQLPTLQRWGAVLAERLNAGSRVFTAGNGGSAAEAQHFSSELVGRFDGDRQAYPAIALTTDSSAVTAIANDYGYENVFARQIEAHGNPGDVLILLSTSGASPNLLRAAEAARRRGVETWALTGPGSSALGRMSDEVIAVDAPRPNVQEAHLMAVHSICTAFDGACASDDARSEDVARDTAQSAEPTKGVAS